MYIYNLYEFRVVYHIEVAGGWGRVCEVIAKYLHVCCVTNHIFLIKKKRNENEAGQMLPSLTCRVASALAATMAEYFH